MNCETFVKSFYDLVTFRPRFCRTFRENFYQNGVRNRQFGYYFSQNGDSSAKGVAFSLQKWLKILTSMRKVRYSAILSHSVLTLLRILCLQENLILAKVPSRAHMALSTHSGVRISRQRRTYLTDFHRGGPF